MELVGYFPHVPPSASAYGVTCTPTLFRTGSLTMTESAVPNEHCTPSHSYYAANFTGMGLKFSGQASLPLSLAQTWHYRTMSKYSAQHTNRMGFAKKYPLAARTAVIMLWLVALIMLFRIIEAVLYHDVLGLDAHAYWLAGQGELEYGRRPMQKDAYLYSPAFRTVISPLVLLPWTLFLPLWICLEAALLVWLLKPLRAVWAIPIFLLCLPELLAGNIYIFLAGAAVIGIQKPVAWAFPILTKVTTGVGLLWFAVRGEWWQVLKAVGGLFLIVTVLYLVNPAEWHAWVRFLFEHREGTMDGQTIFFLRCLLAVVLVVVGARKHWPWLIAPAMVLASPVLVGLIPFSMLAAIPRLARLPRHDVDCSNLQLSKAADTTAGSAETARNP